TSSPRTTTAPTRGFGCTRPQPLSASESARLMWARSLGVAVGAMGTARRSDRETKREAAEEIAPLGIEVDAPRQRAGDDIRSGLPPHLAHETEDQHRPGDVAEEHEAAVVEIFERDADRVRSEARRVVEAEIDVAREMVVPCAEGQAEEGAP